MFSVWAELDSLERMSRFHGICCVAARRRSKIFIQAQRAPQKHQFAPDTYDAMGSVTTVEFSTISAMSRANSRMANQFR